MATQTIGRILVEETLEHLAGLDAERTRNTNGALQYHLEQVVFGVLRGRIQRLIQIFHIWPI